MTQTLKKATPSAISEIKKEMKVRRTSEVFLFFPLGSQFDHLIVLTLARLGVYCLPCDPSSMTAEDVRTLNPKGIILSGGPVSVAVDPPTFDTKILDLSIPVLGICLGFQLWAQHAGFKVAPASKREFGRHTIKQTRKNKLFERLPESFIVLQSHGDAVEIPEEDVLSYSETKDEKTGKSIIAAAQHKHFVGVQFHPEVTATEYGDAIFQNFCFKICNAKDSFPALDIAKKKVGELKEQIQDKSILLALSGGTDSSTVAYLLKEAMKNSRGSLYGLYIKGIDRPDDERRVRKYFENKSWITLHVTDATKPFLAVFGSAPVPTTMPEKRLAMRDVYKHIIDEKARELGVDFIAQGTLYTDIVESGFGYESKGVRKAQIKHHHNVNLEFSVPELMPLADLVKDSGRALGEALGVPDEILKAQPFPGPGLVVRIEGVITSEKLRIAREIDKIWIEELRTSHCYDEVWQAGAALLSSVHTCSKGDDAASGYIVMLFAVNSVDGFTARSAQIPEEVKERVSRRMTDEIREVGAVTYRYGDKPPTTIEMG